MFRIDVEHDDVAGSHHGGELCAEGSARVGTCSVSSALSYRCVIPFPKGLKQHDIAGVSS
jgi:hypothetical protein